MPTTAERALHRALTGRLLLETTAVFLALAGAAVVTAERGLWPLTIAACVLQGCWLHRLYLVGHEAVHRKLVPDRPGLNDLIGQLILLPLMVPIGVYRQIHRFHHGHNRRDAVTSALDTWVLAASAGWPRRLAAAITWFVAVFAGGFFIHSLVSIVLFLALPLRLARRVSPAFDGWSASNRRAALAAFAAGVAVHTAVALSCGAATWALVLGWPLLAFAWVYSLFVYIYHYDTSYGSPVRDNVRSLAAPRWITWWLLNFNEHATHHADASIPWHRLPHERRPPNPRVIANQRVTTFAAAILRQLRGPRFLTPAEAATIAEERRGDR